MVGRWLVQEFIKINLHFFRKLSFSAAAATTATAAASIAAHTTAMTAAAASTPAASTATAAATTTEARMEPAFHVQSRKQKKNKIE